jgi:alpha/beta superfamily hydrolase
MSEAGFPCNQPVMLVGPAGAVEAITLCPAQGAVAATAVILHPHPLHGGTLHNKVVHTLARGFADCGVASVRFNFRGVGASEGSFAHGDGETADALTVIDWVRAMRPGDAVWLAGFSFGAYVALRAGALAPVAGLVTVAPAVHLYDFATLDLPDCPWLLVQGEADEVVAVETVRGWVGGLARPPVTRFLPGVGHFFHQRLPELRDCLREFVAPRLPTGQRPAG